MTQKNDMSGVVYIEGSSVLVIMVGRVSLSFVVSDINSPAITARRRIATVVSRWESCQDQ